MTPVTFDAERAFVSDQLGQVGQAFMQIDVLRDRLKHKGVDMALIRQAEACVPVEAARLMREMDRTTPEQIAALNRTAESAPLAE